MNLHGSILIILLAIFLARIVDVSIGTLRIIFITRGLKYLAALLGFVESLIWIIAISQVMKNIDSGYAYLAFAGGFASGNVAGIWLEERIALGTLVVRIISRRDSGTLATQLRAAEFSVTRMDGEGEQGQVMMLFTIARRKRLPEVIALIREHDPDAVYTVEDVRFASPALAGLAARRPALRRPFSLRA